MIVICPSGEYYDTALKRCVSNCTGTYEQQIGNTCVCKSGYEYFGPNCVPKCRQN